MTIVAFLEEKSAEAFLKVILPKLTQQAIELRCQTFEGKQDLEKNLERRMRGWLAPGSRFLVLRDRDSDDCRAVKKRLSEICRKAGHPEALVRVACGELESFYLGDLGAVAAAFDCKVPSSRLAKYRSPDKLANDAQELRRLTGGQYQKVSGSRAIAPFLKLDGTNRSESFNALVAGIRKILADADK